MKIRINLFGEEQLEELDKSQELQAILKEIGVDGKNIPYIELDTGGELDDLSKEAQMHFEKGMGIFLRRFGQLLLAGINFDLAMRARGQKTMPGVQAIEEGLELIDEKMKIVVAQLSALEY